MRTLLHKAPKGTVVYFPVSPESKYIELITTAIPDRYSIEFLQGSSIESLLKRRQRGEALLLHVHWEEFAFFRCDSDAAANAKAQALARQLERFKRAGGRIVWTIHNGVPHRMPYLQAFLQLRTKLAQIAHIILVHNQASIEFLCAQVGVDTGRLRVLPHPSYLGSYELEEATIPRLLHSDATRTILGFGTLRDQKGFVRMIDMLPPDFLRERQATIRIVGKGREADVMRLTSMRRQDVVVDLGYAPDSEVPELLRSAACIVLPYRQFLTSGIAHLAMTFGAITVAPRVSQFEEITPGTAKALLFTADDPDDFRRAIDAALALTPAERLEIATALMQRAKTLHPRKISADLLKIYDTMAIGAAPGWLERRLRALLRRFVGR